MVVGSGAGVVLVVVGCAGVMPGTTMIGGVGVVLGTGSGSTTLGGGGGSGVSVTVAARGAGARRVTVTSLVWTGTGGGVGAVIASAGVTGGAVRSWMAWPVSRAAATVKGANSRLQVTQPSSRTAASRCRKPRSAGGEFAAHRRRGWPRERNPQGVGGSGSALRGGLGVRHRVGRVGAQSLQPGDRRVELREGLVDRRPLRGVHVHEGSGQSVAYGL
jgi:hypothetical protein